MRCIALAQAWQERGGDITFLSHCENDGLRQRISDEGFRFIPIENAHPHPSDLEKILSVLSDEKENTGWLVLDGYHFDTAFQKAIRDKGIRLLVIDDMNHLSHYHADVLLNQNIHAPTLKYSCDEDTIPLMGCKYVMLRREFLEYREWKRVISEKAAKILVTMGGSDPDNVTLKIIQALNLMNDTELEVKFVVGPVNPNIESIRKELSRSNFTYNLLSNVKNMPELMAWTDVAISAAGSTCWELCLSGVPFLGIISAENQRGIAKGLDHAGAAKCLGWHEDLSPTDIAQSLLKVMVNKRKMEQMSEQGKYLVDNRGSKRIIRTMHTGELQLRPVQSSGCELLWQWANDTDTRRPAFYTEPISCETHEKWLEKKIRDTNRLQFIAVDNKGVPIGQTCFDIISNVAEVDYYIDKNYRGLNLGVLIIKKGIQYVCTEIETPLTFLARVKKENYSSNQIFINLNFGDINDKSNVTSTHTHLSITIISDKESWINQYIPEVISKFIVSGHTVSWSHNVSEINNGDIVFYLGCGQMVSPEILSKNKHNLVVHESDLPKGKGWAPLTWQILEGQNEIPITLFEAVKSVDAGKIYMQDIMHFNGTELVDELRKKQAEYAIRLCLFFIKNYSLVTAKAREQIGKPSFYRKRGPKDSKLDPDKTIREQFNLLRVIDNERYPAFFDINGERYLLKIERG
ncbi:UDP-2,4-diacetamido-2,4,6-trideoxy-beta-L-altropyranose hydrolase [Desulfococcaceae bacterium HSG9]|nr:UDP-2,4-diacetamido-2,4,6-trideoxy-beta-L-altropyranose hydrolase [Desulfococcaceae bacterium HSG9]